MEHTHDENTKLHNDKVDLLESTMKDKDANILILTNENTVEVEKSTKEKKLLEETLETQTMKTNEVTQEYASAMEKAGARRLLQDEQLKKRELEVEEHLENIAKKKEVVETLEKKCYLMQKKC